MKKNMGTIDRTIRILVAALFAVLVVAKVVTGPFAVIMLVLSGVFVLTSVASICPLYMLLGINTDKKKAQEVRN
jgi:hypothetical protein